MVLDKIERWTLELDRSEILMIRCALSDRLYAHTKHEIVLDDEELVFIELFEHTIRGLV